jgi:hypothetical protein
MVGKRAASLTAKNLCGSSLICALLNGRLRHATPVVFDHALALAHLRCKTLGWNSVWAGLRNVYNQTAPDDKRGYFRRTFLGAARPLFPGAAMLKSSSFLPDFSAAASQRGFSPRPAQVSLGFSGLRYFGATEPRAPPRPPLAPDRLVASRSSLSSCSWTARRSSTTLLLRAASTCSLSFDSLSIGIDLRFMAVHFRCCARSI